MFIYYLNHHIFSWNESCYVQKEKWMNYKIPQLQTCFFVFALQSTLPNKTVDLHVITFLSVYVSDTQCCHARKLTMVILVLVMATS